MKDGYQFNTQFVKTPDPKTLLELQELLEENNLTFESDSDETLLIRIDNLLVATGSISGNVLKGIAVREKFKNMNLAGDILTNLVTREYQKGTTELLLFTRPENSSIFSQLGFFPVYEVKDQVILMENNPSGLEKYLKGLIDESKSSYPGTGNISSIVVNCNPITNGHLYLIKKAASKSGLLHLFVVSEDRSVFPFEIRYCLIKEATAHIKNLVIHKGGNYIISNATFPSYFIKDSKQIVNLHARLDLGIFSEKIAPSLEITSRFAGDEPFCDVTSNYNRLMREVLPSYGIESIIIKRFETEGSPVSASAVRKFLRKRDFNSIRKMVPSVTYNFLTSPEGDKIIEKLEKDEK